MAIVIPQGAWSLRRRDRILNAGFVGEERRCAVRCVLPDRGHGNRVFIFGMGYTSRALASTLKQQGWEVAGTCRSEAKRSELEEQGFGAHLFNPEQECLLRDEALRELRKASHIVSSIPPVGASGWDPVLGSHGEELRRAAWIGYLSSTSVYGDWQGAWVDEATNPRPVEERAVARWEAENKWTQLGDEAGACVRVFRLGGIYGPGRSAIDAVLREKHTPSARQRLRGKKAFTSRVHVADICQVIAKAMALGSAGARVRVFNVVDDDPSPRAAAMAYARQLVGGASAGDLSDTDLSAPSNSSHGACEKRVSNRRVKEELQVELLYPSFRAGLEAIAIAIASNNPSNTRE